MADGRRHRGRVIGRAPRAVTNWSRLVDATYGTVAAGTKVLFSTVTLSNPGISETVRRTRGVVTVRSDQTGGDEPQLGAMGMIVVNDLAIAAGVASIPGPVTDASDDGWFVWVPFLQSRMTDAARNSEQYQFDSKAMRRVEEGFTVAIVFENASATFGLQAAAGISILSSLS